VVTATSTRASRAADQWLLDEGYQDDVNKLAESPAQRGISRCIRPPAAPGQQPRWHANMTLGGDQELIAALHPDR
jgi:hypothetical protein